MKVFLSFVMLMFSVMCGVAHAANFNMNTPQVAEIQLGTGTLSVNAFGAYLPKKSKIEAVYFVNGGNITPSDSNNALISLKAGTTVIATHSTALA